MDTKVADPLNGALLGERYRIVGLLARGGMARVYQARDERLDRTVAIKIIQPHHARDTEFLQRLADEARTVARLGHPNVVAVYDQGSHEGAPYLVMEYVRGRTLRQVLEDRRRLDPAESLALLEQILAALAVAHRAGLVHRDVKPENVLVAPPPNGSGDLVDAVVKVADFGLAARPVDIGERGGGGQLLATAEYVAPELVADGHADSRADVYSSGIVLFELLTGRVPFDGSRPADVAWQHVDEEVPAPSQIVAGLPQLVDDVVARATARDPAGRPRDAGTMLAEIQAAREDLGALAGPTRAMAHPTVVVKALANDDRPSWARLPAPRRSPLARAVRTRPTIAMPGPQARDILPGRVRDALASARARLHRLSTDRRGRQQLTAVVVVLGILLVAGGWWLGFGRYTQAPPLVQLTKASAEAEASRLGFRVQYGPGVYSEEAPVDTVVDQSPAPGGRIAKGGTVTLVLSLGPERYAVPDVAGMVLEFAMTRMEDANLVAEEKDGYSDTLPVGYVTRTEPPAGELLPPGGVVQLFVARGPFPVHVPAVVGLQLPDAQGQLTNAGFAVEVGRTDDESKPRDYVLEQDPPAGQGMASADGQSVRLVVANGPPSIPMPNFIDQSCNFAADQLQAMGFDVDVQANPIERQVGRVATQAPPPDQPVEQGTRVQIRCQVF